MKDGILRGLLCDGEASIEARGTQSPVLVKYTTLRLKLLRRWAAL